MEDTRKHLTKAQAVAQFKEGLPPNAFMGLDNKLDKIARWQAWNDYTDMLCKDGQISNYQYSSWVGPY
jgi:hypothetical protein